MTSTFSGTVGGTVNFKNGGSPISAACTGATVTAGVATCSIASPGLPAGTHALTVDYLGDASFAPSSAPGGSLVITPATSTTTVTSNAPGGTVPFGSAVTYTITVQVTPPGAISAGPPGTVTLQDNGTAFPVASTCSPALSLSAANPGIKTCAATYNGTAPLTGGTHSITAAYTGNSNIASSNNTATPLSLNVTKTDVTIGTPVSSRPTPNYNQNTVLSVVVTPPGSPAATGTVNFYDGATLLNATPIAVVSSGSTSLPARTFTVGNHTITAVYSGDGNYNQITSAALLLRADKDNTATTLTVPGSAVVWGQNLHLVGHVVADHGGVPTGTVTFRNGATILGTATLNASGDATLDTTGTAVGTYSNVQADYAGDGNMVASSSTQSTVTVNAANTTTAVGSSANPAGSGANITFTAVVTAVSPGAGTPAGTVDFLDGAITIGSASTTGGSATFSTSSLTVGSHTIRANFTPTNSNFNASTTNPGANLTQVINKGNASISVTSSGNPVDLGQSVTFTATLNGIAPALGTPAGGKVTFTIDGVAGTAITIAGSQATYTTSFSTGGNHTVTASYDGALDANFNSAGPSALYNQRVQSANTTVTLLTNPAGASVYGQPVTFTATVAVVAPATGTPTGSVQFKENGNVIASCTLAGGACNASYGLLSVGSHSLTANYLGDSGGLYTAASSGAATFAVDKNGATVQTVTVTPTGLPGAPPYKLGQTLTLSADVTAASPGVVPPAARPSGTVTFYDNGTPIGTGTLSSPATLSLATIPAGTTHVFTASYGGDSNYNSAAAGGSSANTVISPAAPTVTVSASPSPALYGNPYTLTATVTGVGSFPPNGTVSISTEGGAILACAGMTLTVNGDVGTASCNPPAGQIPTGPHTLTAAFTPNSALPVNYGTANSSGTAFAINPATINFVISSSANPSIPGQAVTLTAAASVGTGAIAAIPGTVNFKDGSSTLCSGVSAAAATCPAISSLALGNHTISLEYSPGVADAAIGTVLPAGGLIQQVNQASVDFLITSNAASTGFGQLVTFTVSLTAHAPASGTPGGTVSFFDNGSAIGPSRSLTSGSATLSVGPGGDVATPLSVGTHNITVQYGGDSNFGQLLSTNSVAPSQRNYLQTVTTGAPTIDAVSASPDPSPYGAPFTLSTKVHPAFAGGPQPTGTVTFYDGGTVVGNPAALTSCPSGPATDACAAVTNNRLSVGTHSNLHAVYNGNTTYSTVDSATGTISITAAPTMVSVNPISSVPFGGSVTMTAQVTASAPSTVNPTLGAGSISFYDGSTARMLGTANINASGLASFTIPAVAGAGTGSLLYTTGTSTVGTHNIIAMFTDAANPSGNYQSSTSSSVPLAVTAAATTVGVTSSANPSVYGQTVTLTASVQAVSPGSGIPGGTVQFKAGGSNIGGAVALTSIGGVAQAALPYSALPLGDKIITVTYNGDDPGANFAAGATSSTGPLVQTINKAATSTLLSICGSFAGNACTPLNSASVVGQQVVLVAQVLVTAPGSGAPTGTVSFFNETTSLGSGSISAAGAAYYATLTLNSLPQGNLSLTATYSGDSVGFLGSTSPVLTQAVNKPQVTISLTTSASPSILGTPTVLTVTVTPVTPGAGTPTGIIQFYDGTNLMASLQLSGGQAAYTANLAVGNHDVAAKYSGDANFQPQISPSIPQIVTKIPSTIQIGSSAVVAVASQPIVFTAQIGPPPPPGVPYPGGQVAFYDGSTQIGVGTLSGGLASVTVGNLIAGLHNVSVVWSGDDHYLSATSAFVPQTVTIAQTNTQMTASVNPSVFGQPVTVTVNVSVAYPGTVPASGFVQLYDNNNALGDQLVANNGVFTLTIPGFTSGTHNLIAKFQQNGSFGASQSATLTQIVNKAPTATTLAALPFSSTSNQKVMLTAVVQVTAPGAGLPTGSVQFVNSTISAILGTAPIQTIGGVMTATITTDKLTQSGAPQILTATYSGDSNFDTSTSNPQGQTVFGSELAVTGAASYTSSNFAPDQIASIFGSTLANTILSAEVVPLPTSLGGTTVEVTDAAGVKRLSQLFFVSPGQINFLIPSQTAFGLANVKVTNGFGATSSTIILVTRTAPGIFSANASGQGIAAAQITRVRGDLSQSIENVAGYDSSQGTSVATPIDMSNVTDQLYLVLYGTGIRYNPGLSKVTATINGVNVPVQYGGASPGFVGLDQINLGPIPASLRGAGTVNVVVTVDGQASNTVTLTFK